MIRFCVILLLTLLIPRLASSKRLAPPEVHPVIHEGIRYVAPNDNGRRGYIQAWDVASKQKLWELTVFTNRIDPKLEEDVQWVFIKKLNANDGKLMVTSERGNTYEIDLNTKTITQPDPPPSSSPRALEETPDAAKRPLTKGPLGKGYDFSAKLHPSHLQGDFNGDGKIDVAVLIKQRSTRKLGIAIIHGTTGKVTILGAGSAIGNGGDDFEWMDSWTVYSQTRAAHAAGETSIPRLRGDALLVEKSEAASALIYWNGKRYAWLQQGD